MTCGVCGEPVGVPDVIYDRVYRYLHRPCWRLKYEGA
jgi:hypothetical protein